MELILTGKKLCLGSKKLDQLPKNGIQKICTEPTFANEIYQTILNLKATDVKRLLTMISSRQNVRMTYRVKDQIKIDKVST